MASAKLQDDGEYNYKNAAFALAAAKAIGQDFKKSVRALTEYRGVKRRFERAQDIAGAKVYFDFAHHPSEIASLINRAKPMGKILVVFQPHTYSRTKALFQDFVDELRTVDQAVLADIYAAREQNTVGISSQDLAAEVPGAVYCPSLQGVTAYLRGIAQPGDIILTVGAGDIYKAGEALLAE